MSSRHVLRQMKAECDAVKAEWDVSPKRTELISAIEDIILPAEGIHLDSACCLGLGTFRPKTNRHERFYRFRQLITFETILAHLGTKYEFKAVYFQGPEFSPIDVEFLELRDHIVVPFPYDASKSRQYEDSSSITLQRKPLDRNMLGSVSSSTMFFSAGLSMNLTAEFVRAVRPFLYLGTKPQEILQCDMDWVISPSLQKDFKKFVDSCEVELDASRFFKHITEESFLWRRSGSLEKAVVD
ncbi:hypothetical protein DL95DRAFT_408074 [Leptodontidium sp. 2 PMI_412]|nr:hypothetical protein DL95DRAFT_408074 [Leptodontidium sp. 2 PMI_412]